MPPQTRLRTGIEATDPEPVEKYKAFPFHDRARRIPLQRELPAAHLPHMPELKKLMQKFVLVPLGFLSIPACLGQQRISVPRRGCAKWI